MSVSAITATEPGFNGGSMYTTVGIYFHPVATGTLTVRATPKYSFEWWTNSIPPSSLVRSTGSGNLNIYGVDVASQTTGAVNTIISWWEHLGRGHYPHAHTLTITADSGGSNNPRTRLWRHELQRLADTTGLSIRVCHFPPGTSKWNKIEHRLFCHISQTWRGRPLISYQVIINSIAATTTSSGLKVYARLDEHDYPKKIEVTNAEIAAVNLTPDPFHPEWNYTISRTPDPAA